MKIVRYARKRSERASDLPLPLRLDVANALAWRGERLLKLTPKAFAVLHYLSEHSRQLVTKDELMQTVWADTVVTDGALAACIRELRKALHDDVQTPQYIETVHRRGYRWITADATPVSRSTPKVHRSSVPSNQHPASPLVGRETDLALLHQWWEKALSGERQLIFITGQPGIGKTTLVKALRQRLVLSPPSPSLNPLAPVFVGYGQCIEHYGAGEAYLPVLEALGRLCRDPEGERLIALLSRHAPTWLVQMPTLLNATELEVLQRKAQGAVRERMLRELAETLEVITAERPLMLVLEDLHWSDPSTLDLLSMVARRTDPARLLIIGTYRPVDVIVREHPLQTVKHELQLHGHCQELALELLGEAAIANYLLARFEALSPTGLALPTSCQLSEIGGRGEVREEAKRWEQERETQRRAGQ